LTKRHGRFVIMREDIDPESDFSGRIVREKDTIGGGGTAMPIHDWTRVDAGIWHAFHLAWISEIQLALNSGRLPSSYYALAEQVAGPMGPDVLTLQSQGPESVPETVPTEPDEGGLAVATVPPQTWLVDESDVDAYASMGKTLVIRHVSGDRIVGFLELVSPGNKGSRSALQSFVDKALEALYRGFHLLIVDLFPPTSRDPQGIHGAIWSELSNHPFQQPTDRPLTLAAYSAGPVKRAYVEPTAVGRELREMPLFLESERYVNVPLEETYQAAYRGVPGRWKHVLEDRPAAR
jgi:hypothetical protein